MQDVSFNGKTFRAAFVLVLVLGISLLFLAVTWPFLQALLLGAIFAGLCTPIYRWLVKIFRGRRSLASGVTLLILFLIIVGPLSAFLGIVVKQAIGVSDTAIPWVQAQFSNSDTLDPHAWLVERLPVAADLVPSKEEIMKNVSIAVQGAGTFLVSSASRLTAGTAGLLLDFFVMFYAMFFFLKDGSRILEKIFYYMPLSHDDEVRMLERFISVTRATIKGTLLIGLIQGSLAAFSFWLAGIQGIAFWGTVMVILSVIPGIGSALVWIPAVIYLYISGEPFKATAVAIWCAAIVGTVDNVLRPILVGKDAKMPDLLILVGTLGGLFLFGPIGFIVGPVVCGLFLTAWDIYGTAFAEILPPVKKLRLGQGVRKKVDEPSWSEPPPIKPDDAPNDTER
ncbi:MAG: AI-2E family transporter [Chthoniobacterales bacterium]